MRFPGGGRMRLKTFAKRLYEEYENDAVADSAAALSYYFVFALFPFLFFLATLTAFVPYIRRSVDTILERAHAILPEQAVGLVDVMPTLLEALGQPVPETLSGRSFLSELRGEVMLEDVFRATAIALEDTGVSAYAGQAPLIDNTAILKAALSIHSVEARHAAWIRNIAGQIPAPNAFDPALTKQQVLDIVASTGFIVS